MSSARTIAATRLHSRPIGAHHPDGIHTGLARIELGPEAADKPAQTALVYIPKNYARTRPLPLVVLCHGAGGDSRNGMGLLQGYADEEQVVLLATSSVGRSWDMISGKDFGPDVKMMDKALHQLFSVVAIDPSRVAIGGFSDGGSYALSVGSCNGDLFTHIIAFSPGFMSSPQNIGTPKVYVSHGKEDKVLPIDRCSQRLVPRLRGEGYEVKYNEFNGPHTVPREVAKEALAWFLKTPSTSPLHQSHAHRFA